MRRSAVVPDDRGARLVAAHWLRFLGPDQSLYALARAMDVEVRVRPLRALCGGTEARLMPEVGGWRATIDPNPTPSEQLVDDRDTDLIPWRLAHELAHTCFYGDGAGRPVRLRRADAAEERFCDQVAGLMAVSIQGANAPVGALIASALGHGQPCGLSLLQDGKVVHAFGDELGPSERLAVRDQAPSGSVMAAMRMGPGSVVLLNPSESRSALAEWAVLPSDDWTVRHAEMGTDAAAA